MNGRCPLYHLYEIVLESPQMWMKFQASCDSPEQALAFLQSRLGGEDPEPPVPVYPYLSFKVPAKLSKRTQDIANWAFIKDRLPDSWDDYEFRLAEGPYPWCETLTDDCDCFGPRGRLDIIHCSDFGLLEDADKRANKSQNIRRLSMRRALEGLGRYGWGGFGVRGQTSPDGTNKEDFDSKINRMTTLIITTTPQGEVAQGTGFFYSVSDPAEPGGPQYQWVQTDIWVLTNRHVVMPEANGVETRPSAISVHLQRWDALGRLEWAPVVLSSDDIKERVRLHPDEHVDVAAIDMSKLLTQEIESNRDRFTYNSPFCLSRDLLMRNNQKLQIQASSEVLIVGYPKGYYDGVNLFPIVKSGIVASKWGAEFRGAPCFLIDAKLFPGSSGSVVISKPIDVVVENGQLFVIKDGEKAFALLGIFSGAFEDLDYGFGIAWYAETIGELLRT